MPRYEPSHISSLGFFFIYSGDSYMSRLQADDITFQLTYGLPRHDRAYYRAPRSIEPSDRDIVESDFRYYVTPARLTSLIGNGIAGGRPAARDD